MQAQFLLCLLTVPILLCGSKGTFKKNSRSSEPKKGRRIMRCELQGSVWKAYIFPKEKYQKNRPVVQEIGTNVIIILEAKYKIK